MTKLCFAARQDETVTIGLAPLLGGKEAEDAASMRLRGIGLQRFETPRRPELIHGPPNDGARK